MALNTATKCGIVFVCLATIAATIGAFFVYRYAYPDAEEPSLKFEPHGSISSTLIHYSFTNSDSVRQYTYKIDDFLLPYHTPSRQQMQCDFDHPARKGLNCFFDISLLHTCNSKNNYGYHRGSPCVFLTLNKINNWNPIFYNDDTTFPDEMPTYLKEHIHHLDIKQRNNIWVSCAGENDFDEENIGPIIYYPYQGFPGYYFPYTNVEDYLSPIVAIQFERPKRGVVINIECKIWAQNINNNRTGGGSGYARFSLLID